ncbi:hypothetical protein [Actinomadura geliboluensis]|uniref:Uncharacterized protein n=1 Tax=Actinomadura geliboluensis TaxID=882440 RepID=A0A5S4GRD0_9ACTN|nr:hypothetical protein [Actinomadura geliboluensis]TMR28960.1 hypothetical protein ETD96_36525 [Actinomadura geliboluensis]
MRLRHRKQKLSSPPTLRSLRPTAVICGGLAVGTLALFVPAITGPVSVAATTVVAVLTVTGRAGRDETDSTRR